MSIRKFEITDSRGVYWRVMVSSDARHHKPGQNIMDRPRKWTARYYRPDIGDPQHEIVKAILREVVEPHRIVARDVKSYFGILLDDSNRKPLCRLHFNSRQKYISLFDGGTEEKLPLDSLDDIYRMAERLKATPVVYDRQE